MSWQGERYGLLTGAQIERCLEIFREGWADRKSWEKKWEDEGEWVLAVAKVAAVPNWTPFYQNSFLNLVLQLATVVGVSESLVAAIKSDDPLDGVLNVADAIPDNPPEHPATMPLAFAMAANLDCIARYSQSINDLIHVWREQFDIEALLKAISVDSLLTTMPFVQAALRVGQLSADESAAADVFKAVRGPHKKRLVYPELRWAEYLLRQTGAFSSCSREDIYELVSQHLGLYDPRGSQDDGKAALFSLFRGWQKEAGIQKPRFGFSGKRR